MSTILAALRIAVGISSRCNDIASKVKAPDAPSGKGFGLYRIVEKLRMSVDNWDGIRTCQQFRSASKGVFCSSSIFGFLESSCEMTPVGAESEIPTSRKERKCGDL
jgi:hypothetical protein